MSAIKVEKLEKRFHGQESPTLRGVGFDVSQGRLAAVLGASGSGKSTLLRCLVGLERFDRGAIALGDVVVRGDLDGGPGARDKAVRALRGQVGLVFQQFELFPHLSVIENCVLAPCQVRGEPRGEAEARALSLLDDLGLSAKHAAYPEQLSGGQRQRVAIARALAMRPRVLLYDEPTSALDPSLKREVQESLHRVRATGVTQIVVTHDLQLARDSAEVVYVLHDGQIAEHGPPDEVLGSPKTLAARRLVEAVR
jgi:ABC-type polar amino acid transport system ATPase subunit